MSAKTDRLEARISTDQRKVLERAANLAGTSLSSFVVEAAMERAEDLVSAQTTTVIAAEYFDAVARTLDRADKAPLLSKAVRRAERSPRIAGR